MLNAINSALVFMRPTERIRFYVFLALRGIVAFLDLVGILAIGFLATSVALFLTDGSDPNRRIEVGDLSIVAISAKTLPFVAFGILLLFLLKALSSILLTRQMAQFLARIEARAARVITKRAFGEGLDCAKKHSMEEIVFAVQVGSPSAFNLVMNSAGTIFAEGFLFVLVFTAFAIVNPAAAFAAIIYFGTIGLLIQFFIGRLMHQSARAVAASTVQANAVLTDLSEVLREASILGRRSYFYNKLFNTRFRAAGNTATMFVLSGTPRYIVETALIIAITIFILIQTLAGDIASSAATIGIFLSGGLRLTASLLPLQSALLTIRQAIPAAERALSLVTNKDSKIEYPRQVKSSAEPAVALRVETRDLSFTYRGSSDPVLQEINLEIPPGSQAALIGPSGAGKSTLADLLLGLLRPDSGRIELGGLTAAELIESQPGILGYVPQRPGMVSGTIAENIALGIEAKDIDSALMERAIKDACLVELIASLPDGLQTNLGKRKDEFSGGQLQRIGLARALYSQPKLLVMDEATSALDAESESNINRALDAMRGNVTVILIAHRLNTVQRSDVVFLMEKGRVTASGTFLELLKSNSTVSNLVKLMAVESD